MCSSLKKDALTSSLQLWSVLTRKVGPPFSLPKDVSSLVIDQEEE